jgi:hypothetical protein
MFWECITTWVVEEENNEQIVSISDARIIKTLRQRVFILYISTAKIKAKMGRRCNAS